MNMMNTTLESELVGLFGRWTYATAQVRRFDDLKINLESLKTTAELVVAQRGHPERQRAIVDALDEDTAVALCIWLRDPANAAEVAKQAKTASRGAKKG
jgi:hypothetical protein